MRDRFTFKVNEKKRIDASPSVGTSAVELHLADHQVKLRCQVSSLENLEKMSRHCVSAHIVPVRGRAKQ